MSTPLLKAPRPYQVVRVIAIRDARFSEALVQFDRHPKVGDIGTVLEIYPTPELGFEVECSNPDTGETVWLEAMHADEIEVVSNPIEQRQP